MIDLTSTPGVEVGRMRGGAKIMVDKIDLVEKEYLKKDIPEFKPGDEIKVFSEIPPQPEANLKKKVVSKIKTAKH